MVNGKFTEKTSITSDSGELDRKSISILNQLNVITAEQARKSLDYPVYLTLLVYKGENGDINNYFNNLKDFKSKKDLITPVSFSLNLKDILRKEGEYKNYLKDFMNLDEDSLIDFLTKESSKSEEKIVRNSVQGRGLGVAELYEKLQNTIQKGLEDEVVKEINAINRNGEFEIGLTKEKPSIISIQSIEPKIEFYTLAKYNNDKYSKMGFMGDIIKRGGILEITKEDLAKSNYLVAITSGNFIGSEKIEIFNNKKNKNEKVGNPKRRFLMYLTKDPIIPYIR